MPDIIIEVAAIWAVIPTVRVLFTELEACGLSLSGQSIYYENRALFLLQ